MEFVKNMLTEQRKRAVAMIMRSLEAEAYPGMRPDQRDGLRRKVLDAIDRYHDTCLDMLKSSVNDGTAVNDEAIRLLVQLHGKVDRQVGGGNG